MLTEFFSEIGISLTDDASHIYNLDETGLNLEPTKQKFLYQKGSKDTPRVVPSEGKGMHTVLVCGNANGEYLPPSVVFKEKGRQIFPSWMSGAPEGTCFNVTPSGWMEDYAFEEWIVKIFLEFVENQPKPVVLFFDGHNSHLTYRSAINCQKNGIHLICLPPSTSHALQLMDVSVFGPMKTVWRNILPKFYQDSKAAGVTKGSFCVLLNQLWAQSFTSKPQNLVKGFKKTGLYPVDMHAIPQSKIIVTVDFEQTSEKNTGSSANINSVNSITNADTEVAHCLKTVASPNLLDQPVRCSSPAAAAGVIDSSTLSDISMVSSSTSLSCPDTPTTRMSKALHKYFSGAKSQSTAKALAANKRKRSQVQKRFGEILTEPEAMKHLKAEEEARNSK